MYWGTYGFINSYPVSESLVIEIMEWPSWSRDWFFGLVGNQPPGGGLCHVLKQVEAWEGVMQMNLSSKCDGDKKSYSASHIQMGAVH